jgi:phosphoglycerate kinase
MRIKTIKDFDVKDKLILIRVDINSPVSNGKIMDNPRLKGASETIKYILNKKGKLVVIAHQGRKGDKDFLPLEQHALFLSKYSGKKIKYVDALFEDEALEEIDKLEMGQGILLKNVREYDDEKNLEGSRFYSFSKLFDLYVNDAFSVSHRAQGSIVIPPKVIPGCAGINMAGEIEALSNLVIQKNKKAVYIVSGSKIEDYLPLFNVLDNKNAKIIAAGVLGNLFLIANGRDLGFENSWVKEKGYGEMIPKLKAIYDKHKEQIILPIDFAVGPIVPKERKELGLQEFPSKMKIWDIGQKSMELFKSEIGKAEIVFMKGPLGYSEMKEFSNGTVEVLKEVSELTKKKKIFSLLGGGHLTTSIQEYKIPDNFSHISTSGGALIAFISGEKLPGIEALENGTVK